MRIIFVLHNLICAYINHSNYFKIIGKTETVEKLQRKYINYKKIQRLQREYKNYKNLQRLQRNYRNLCTTYYDLKFKTLNFEPYY